MTRYSALLALGWLALTACGPKPQVAPPPKPVATQAPEQPDPAPVTDGAVTVAYENGLRIIVKRIEGAELASIQLYIRGGARLRTAETAGIELLALRAAVEGGTETRDKDAFGRELSRLGTDLGASSRNAYSVMAAKTLTGNLDESFALLAGAFLAPAMTDSEIALQRDRLLATIAQQSVTPDGRLALLVNDAVYAGHPFDNLPTGTKGSVSSLTPAMLRDHLATLRVTSRLELVVVGDVGVEQVQGLVSKHFGALPRGAYQHQAVGSPSFSVPKLTLVEAELPTTYIEASFVAPRWDDPDFVTSILAMRILSRRLWEEVRTKRNLSYAPSARHGWSGESPRGSLYVTAVDPNTTMKVMLDQVAELQSSLVDDKELAGAKAVFVTSHLMSNETTDGQGSWLAMCDLVGGDFRLAHQIPARIKEVTAEQIRAYANEHIHHLQTVVLGPVEMGPTGGIDATLFKSL